MGNSCDTKEYFPLPGVDDQKTLIFNIDQNAYKSCESSPVILTTYFNISVIGCTAVSCNLIYKINIGDLFSIQVVYINNGSVYVVDQLNTTGNPKPSFPSKQQPTNLLSFDVILPEGLKSSSYVPGDVYSFIGVSGVFYLPNYMHFTRSARIESNLALGSQIIINTLTNNLSNSEIQIPSILIQSQTLIDAADIGDTTFKIIDNIEYYNKKAIIIPKHVCVIEKIDAIDAKITNFEKYCPKGVDVLRGKGYTAYEKVVYLFNTNNLNIYLKDFASNLLEYAMLKYLLGRILYGKFNMKYILQKYNDKLLKDLSNSRFCHFVEFFTNPTSKVYGYNQYFL